VDRRRFLLFPLAAFPVAGYARYVEPTWLELTHDRVPVKTLQPGNSIRIAHLSDLHASLIVPKSLIEQAFALSLEQKPDVVCLTGDYITENVRFDETWLRRTLRGLSEKVPCFATLGNHDGNAWSGRPGTKPYTTAHVTEILESSGIPVLTNKRAEVPVRGKLIRLVGCGDLWAHQCNPWIAFRGTPKDDIPTIILSHNPDSKASMDEFRWDLMLCGHTHGGQVVMPILGLSPAPVLDKRYVKGLKAWNGRMINVSAGVGSIEGVRFNCRPQVNLLELYTA
jgi:predicted MPP superfamily phosphohydrolase